MKSAAPLAHLQGAVEPQFGEVHIRSRGRLPHWEKNEGLYFITFHLADSLPRAVLSKIKERHQLLEAARQSHLQLTAAQQAELAAFDRKHIEEYADRGTGSCIFREQNVAGMMAAALRHRDGQHYRLLAWCIMPNHVHVVVKLHPGRELAAVVRSWKSFSAKAANATLARNGNVWQREYYDRLLRNAGELLRAIHYTLDNPIRAGLSNWPWAWSAGIETDLERVNPPAKE